MEAAETLIEYKIVSCPDDDGWPTQAYLLTIMPVEVTTEVRPLERVMVWAAPPLLMEFILGVLQCKVCLYFDWPGSVSVVSAHIRLKNVPNIMLSPRQFVLMRRN